MSSFRSAAVRLAEAVSARSRGFLLFPLLALRNRSSRDWVLDANAGVAVSMTSYGVRLRHVHLVIESIARGHARPAKLILWLSPEEAARPLPRGLRRLQDRGLSVRACQDLGSHKKYFPFAVGGEVEDHVMVTADDDVYYPPYWLWGLMEAQRADPHSVWCYRSRTMVLDEDHVAPYDQWPLSVETGPSLRLVPTGVSGVLYPSSVVDEMRSRGTEFLELAPTADDIWLHALTVGRGIRIRRVARRPHHFAVAPSAKGVSLMSQNLSGGNDAVVRRLYGPALRRSIMFDGLEWRDTNP